MYCIQKYYTELSLSCECRSLWLVVGSLMVWGAMGACMNVPSMELLIDTAMYVHGSRSDVNARHRVFTSASILQICHSVRARCQHRRLRERHLAARPHLRHVGLQRRARVRYCLCSHSFGDSSPHTLFHALSNKQLLTQNVHRTDSGRVPRRSLGLPAVLLVPRVRSCCTGMLWCFNLSCQYLCTVI